MWRAGLSVESLVGDEISLGYQVLQVGNSETRLLLEIVFVTRTTRDDTYDGYKMWPGPVLGA